MIHDALTTLHTRTQKCISRNCQIVNVLFLVVEKADFSIKPRHYGISGNVKKSCTTVCLVCVQLFLVLYMLFVYTDEDILLHDVFYRRYPHTSLMEKRGSLLQYVGKLCHRLVFSLEIVSPFCFQFKDCVTILFSV